MKHHVTLEPALKAAYARLLSSRSIAHADFLADRGITERTFAPTRSLIEAFIRIQSTI